MAVPKSKVSKQRRAGRMDDVAEIQSHGTPLTMVQRTLYSKFRMMSNTFSLFHKIWYTIFRETGITRFFAAKTGAGKEAEDGVLPPVRRGDRSPSKTF